VMGRGAAERRNSARYKFDKAAAGPAGFARYPDLTIRRPLRWKTRGSRVLSAIAIRMLRSGSIRHVKRSVLRAIAAMSSYPERPETSPAMD
jgi:hypothetical protein